MSADTMVVVLLRYGTVAQTSPGLWISHGTMITVPKAVERDVSSLLCCVALGGMGETMLFSGRRFAVSEQRHGLANGGEAVRLSYARLIVRDGLALGRARLRAKKPFRSHLATNMVG